MTNQIDQKEDKIQITEIRNEHKNTVIDLAGVEEDSGGNYERQHAKKLDSSRNEQIPRNTNYS